MVDLLHWYVFIILKDLFSNIYLIIDYLFPNYKLLSITCVFLILVLKAICAGLFFFFEKWDYFEAGMTIFIIAYTMAKYSNQFMPRPTKKETEILS